MLCKPPRDEDSTVIAHDCGAIKDDDKFVRGIPRNQIVPDEKSPTGLRVSKGLLSPSSTGTQGMSGDLARLVEQASPDVQSRLAQRDFVGFIQIDVVHLRKEKLKVGYSPLKDNPCHCEAWGPARYPQGVQKRLLKLSNWYGNPVDASLNEHSDGHLVTFKEPVEPLSTGD